MAKQMVDERDSNGRFVKGHPGGPGRPPRLREETYLQTLWSVCTLEEWQTVCERAVADAKKGDAKARGWLSEYLMPRAPRGHHVHLNSEPTYSAAERREADRVLDALRKRRMELMKEKSQVG